jgi:hypothetical protein
VHRRDKFKAEAILIDKLMEKVAAGKIELKTHSTRWTKCWATPSGVTGIRLKSTSTDDSTEDLTLQGCFIAIGHAPNTDIFQGQLEMEGRLHRDPQRPQGFCHHDQRARRVCRRRRAGPCLPPGHHQRRHGLHGGAGRPALSGARRATNADGYNPRLCCHHLRVVG